MRALLALTAIAATFVLTACLEPDPPLVGTVTGKSHTAAYCDLLPIADGKGGTSIVPVCYSDTWHVTVRDTTGTTHTADVTEATYKRAHPGDHYDATRPDQPLTTPTRHP